MELLPISDNNLRDALKFIIDIRSIKIGNNEIDYLLRHSRRNIKNLVKIVESLINYP